MTQYQYAEQTVDVAPENEAAYEAAGWGRIDDAKPSPKDSKPSPKDSK